LPSPSSNCLSIGGIHQGGPSHQRASLAPQHASSIQPSPEISSHRGHSTPQSSGHHGHPTPQSSTQCPPISSISSHQFQPLQATSPSKSHNWPPQTVAAPHSNLHYNTPSRQGVVIGMLFFIIPLEFLIFMLLII
jgi:hypothetical protein